MCGIFGIVICEDLHLNVKELMGLTTHMFKLSESRGKEASGIAVRLNKSINVFKEPVSASNLVKSAKYKALFESVIAQQYENGLLQSPLAILGHSRLQTNGLSEINTNNQPVVKDGAVGIHNGIIVNDTELWKSFPQLRKEYDVDTEVFLSLLQMFRGQARSLADAVREVYWHMEGSASIATLFDDTNAVLLATNIGSLYTATSKTGKVLVFASEKYILQQIIIHKNISRLFENSEVKQVKAGQGCLIDLGTATRHSFSLKSLDAEEVPDTEPIPYIPIVELQDSDVDAVRHKDKWLLTDDIKQSMLHTWENLYSGEAKLTRCTRCLLPETMPFINFDKEGVCNFCIDYEHRGTFLKGEEALAEAVSKYRSATDEPDCIVGFSGGRDSAYGLDYIQNKLGLHPITFTYDWGMVNDLARRNQARVVGKLGIEHIVISADIKRKRENIHKNLKAWLKKPDLGMVPILMAGDKQFYYYFHKVRRQTGVKLFIFCGGYEGEEGTGLFKYGFCNVSQGKKKALKRLTGISAINKLKMMGYYLRQFLRNPAYINKSMIDTLFAYYSTYVLRDDYLYLYHYLDWDEETILSAIKEKFNWERETDTIATWRIDDGTASFYNYIYLTMAGFTEFDIFRSHQIREGKLTREEAFNLIIEENKPRFKSIEWYGQAIDFDMNKAILIINKEPTLYETSHEKKQNRQESTVSLQESPELERAPLVVQAKQGLIP